MREEAASGIRLTRAEDADAAIDRLAEELGGRVGIEGVLEDLPSQARSSWAGKLLGRAVDEAWTWERHENRDREWWPQGVTSSADASADETVAGRRLLVTSSYAKQVGGHSRGSRLTVVDLATMRYEHVLLVVPRLADDGRLSLEPLHVHAGGIVWHGPYLHVTATGRGILTCRVDDVLRADDDDRDRLGVVDGRLAAYGHRFVLPVWTRLRGEADGRQERFRYSFLSLDRTGPAPALVAGEYGRRGRSMRLARFEVDPATHLPRVDADGHARPVELVDAGVQRMQGGVVVDGRHHLVVSMGSLLPGRMYVGRPGRLRKRRLALPIGPEDLTYWPSTDRLWSVTEHPRRRWFFSVRRGWFD